MQRGEGQHQARQHEDMQGEEARQRGAGDDRAAQQELDQLPSEKRHAAHNRGADAEAPVGVLVEA
jgi:hypothetical protein